MASCESLSGYMAFVCKVRDNRKKDMSIEDAVRMAVDECIREEIMADFFNEHREEVVGASIWEFDQELNDQAKYEDGYDDGMEAGREEEHIQNLIDKVCKKLKKGKPIDEIADALEESVEEIKGIANAAQKFAPEYPLDKIYDFLKQTGNKQTI